MVHLWNYNLRLQALANKHIKVLPGFPVWAKFSPLPVKKEKRNESNPFTRSNAELEHSMKFNLKDPDLEPARILTYSILMAISALLNELPASLFAMVLGKLLMHEIKRYKQQKWTLKTVWLSSFQKSQLQSDSIFFTFVHPCPLL